METQPCLGVPNGWPEVNTRAALQGRTSPFISPWAHRRTPHAGAELQKYTRLKASNLSARQGILSRCPPPVQVGGTPAVSGRRWRGQRAPAALSGSGAPPAPQRPHPAPAPFSSPASETKMSSRFPRAACPDAGIPAQTLSRSLSSLSSAKLAPQRFQGSEEGPSRAGGQGAMVWGCAEHQAGKEW